MDSMTCLPNEGSCRMTEARHPLIILKKSPPKADDCGRWAMLRKRSKRHGLHETTSKCIAQFQRRRERRLVIPIEGIEPQSKRMADARKDRFQQEVISVLRD